MKNAPLNHVRALRKNMTNTENHLWHYLRAKRLNGYKFRRQHLIHPYVVHFICLSKNLLLNVMAGNIWSRKIMTENEVTILKLKDIGSYVFGMIWF